MRPYLAIIKDSFRAAIHSYVLWVMLFVVTFMLAMLLPFSYGEQLKTSLLWSDVPRWHDVATTLHDENLSNPDGPAGHIWNMLLPQVREMTEKVIQAAEAANVEDQPRSGAAADQARDEAYVMQAEASQVHALIWESLDEMLEKPEFYDEQAWEGIALNEEATKLLAIDAAELSELKLRRRNRLLLEAAFPQVIPRSAAVSVQPTYAGNANSYIFFFLGAGPDGNTREAVIEWYQRKLSFLMNWPVTFALVFVGIIVTSGIVPRMFDPGSITLLLSKPVSRSFLFLSQYAGGCAFMLLASTYFVVGVWLIAGIRFGAWGPNIFLCIPLFVAIFMVYYAVSAIVGLIWRSSIVSVIAVILFFFACYTIGLAKIQFQDTNIDTSRFGLLHPAGNSMMATNNFRVYDRRTYEWNSDVRKWLEVFSVPQGAFDLTEHRVYQPRENRLVAIQGPFNPALVVGEKSDGWSRRGGIPVPSGTFSLMVDPQGDILLASSTGFSRLSGDPLYFEKLRKERDEQRRQAIETEEEMADDETIEDETVEEENASGCDDDTSLDDSEDTDESSETESTVTEEESESADQPEPTEESNEESNEPEEGDQDSETTTAPADTSEPESPIDDAEVVKQPPIDTIVPENPRLESLDQPQPTLADFYTDAGPDQGLAASHSMRAAMDRKSGWIAVYSGGVVFTFKPDDSGRYQQVARRELEDSQEKGAQLAIAGNRVVVGREDGVVLVLDATSLDKQYESQPEDKVAITTVAAGPNGEWFAVLFGNLKLYLFDATPGGSQRLTRAGLWSQGDISAVAFTADGNLLVADQIARVRELELPSLKVVDTYDPVELPYLSDSSTLLGIEFSYFTIHRYVITPLYTILPPVGELGWFFNSIMTGDDTSEVWSFFGSQQSHVQRNPWPAVRSCALFVAVLLGFGCWRISRSEF